MTSKHKLCADIGGTNIFFGYIDTDLKVHSPKEYEISTFKKGSEGFKNALLTYLDDTNDSIDFDLKDIDDLILCVAGRVNNGNVRFTNSDWIISSNTVKEDFESHFSESFDVYMLNDFEALAYGLTTLKEGDFEILDSREGFGQTKIVCGPGTGLGLAALHQTSNELRDICVIASEAGHQTFPVQTETLKNFREYRGEQVLSYEDILSGEGLETLYNFFNQGTANSKNKLSPKEIIKLFDADNNEAERALITFALALGEFCGNMALAFGATSGVYLWGGILKSFPYEILRKNMLSSFKKCSAGTEFLIGIPISIITDDECALKGCVKYCEKQKLLKN